MNRGLLVLASLFLLFLPGSPSLAQESAPTELPVLTLQDAIHIAQGNNPNLKNALLASSIASDQVAEARTARYPSIKIYALGSELLTPVNFTFEQGVFGTFPGIGPIPPENTKIHTPLRPIFFGVSQFTQPLSQQYKIGLNIRLAGLNKTLSDEKLRAQQHQIANQVKQAYYGLLRTQSSLEIDPDRANLAGISNADVASSSTAALSGLQLTTLRDGDKQIPVVSRLRMEERAQLSDIQNLYVYSSQTTVKVPLAQISSIENTLETQRIRRREHFRTISVLCQPVPGALPSEVLQAAMPRLTAMMKSIPPGYDIAIGGERAKQVQGFGDLAVVMGISVAAIFLALVLQFNHAIKPLLVYAAVPYGIVGALIALAIMGTPFGFMAFLGVASLIGVIVSHVIVLFDFIEEMHEKGEPLERALVDAGIMRLRPVIITVGATVLALFPLALHGGPLWEPLCYSQIGGLIVATFITLLLVPVFYSIFVLDLKLVRWEGPLQKE